MITSIVIKGLLGRDEDLTLNTSEIVFLHGMPGHGKTEALNIIFDMFRRDEGNDPDLSLGNRPFDEITVTVDGVDVTYSNLTDKVRHGVDAVTTRARFVRSYSQAATFCDVARIESIPEFCEFLKTAMPNLKFVHEEGKGYKVDPNRRGGVFLSDCQSRILKIIQTVSAAQAGDVVLLDNPENNLHVSFQEELMGVIISRAKRVGFSVVVATQSPYIIGELDQYMVKVGPAAYDRDHHEP